MVEPCELSSTIIDNLDNLDKLTCLLALVSIPAERVFLDLIFDIVQLATPISPRPAHHQTGADRVSYPYHEPFSTTTEPIQSRNGSKLPSGDTFALFYTSVLAKNASLR